MIASVFYNMNRSEKSKPMGPYDFMPKFEEKRGRRARSGSVSSETIKHDLLRAFPRPKKKAKK